MAGVRRVQRYGLTTSLMAAFTGLAREVLVNTTKNTLVVHDGSTQGGHEIARADFSNMVAATGSNLGYMTAAQAALVASAIQFTAGTAMLFVQSAAPVGWTIVATHDDRIIRIDGVAGATTGGSWTISGLTHAHTHTMKDHTHFMQNHVHDRGTLAMGGPSETNNLASGGSGAAGVNHTHSMVSGNTGGASPGDTGVPSDNTSDGASTASVSSDATWRPLYVDVIHCTKD